MLDPESVLWCAARGDLKRSGGWATDGGDVGAADGAADLGELGSSETPVGGAVSSGLLDGTIMTREVARLDGGPGGEPKTINGLAVTVDAGGGCAVEPGTVRTVLR